MVWMRITMFHTTIAVFLAAIGLSCGYMVRQNIDVPDLYATCTVPQEREFPSLVSLEANNMHACAGTILNSKWILTSKTCSLWAQAHTVTVRVGSNRLKEGFPHVVTEIEHHPQCNLALLKLKRPILPKEGVREARLPEMKLEPPIGLGTIAGWGSGTYWKPLSINLKKMDLRIIDTNICNETFVEEGRKIFNWEFCAEYIQRSKPCTGDNGGPLYVNGTLVGVTVGRYRSLKHYAPEVFTKVSYFVDWIEKVITFL